MTRPSGGESLHLEIDRLTDLVHGLMPPEDRLTARDHLVQCEECEGTFRDLLARHEARQADARPLLTPSGAIELGNPTSAPTEDATLAAPEPSDAGSTLDRIRAFLGGAKSPGLGYGLGLAAAALAVVVLWPREVIPPPAVHPWLPGPGSESRLRDPGASASALDLEAGIEAYEQRDLGAAIRLLSQSEATGQDENLRRIYLADAMLRAGRPADAVDLLRPVPSLTLPEPWGPESQWTLSLALLQTGRTAEADSVLRQLAVEPGEIGERARAALAR